MGPASVARPNANMTHPIQIILTRQLLGGFRVTSIRWQDLEEVTLHVGMLSAQLALRAARASDLATLSRSGCAVNRRTSSHQHLKNQDTCCWCWARPS